MLSVNQNLGVATSSVAFKGKGNKIVEEALRKAKNLKCSNVGKAVPKDQVVFEHIERAMKQMEYKRLFDIDPARARETIIRDVSLDVAKSKAWIQEMLKKLKPKG